MNITIIPGSFKPPHKGHLSLIEKLIKDKNNSKIIILITKKSRPLDSRFLYPEKSSKIELQNALIDYLPNEEDTIINLNKSLIIKKIKELIHTNILKSINAQQSLKIWKIYIKYLKDKYNNIILPKIICKICESNSMIKDTFNIVRTLFKNKKQIILMKSEKNKNNKRFNLFEKSFKKYVKTVLFPNIKDIDATGMRTSILNNDKDTFMKYLPKNIENNIKDKIWNICILLQ
jgi:phosphopantetheine adenylyltransferase